MARMRCLWVMVAVLSVAGGASAAQAPREVMQEIIKGLQSPLRTDQMDALRRVPEVSDKGVITDFKVRELLLQYATDRAQRSDMRRIAMQSLLVLSGKALLDVSILDNLRLIIVDKKDAIESRLDAMELMAGIGAGTEDTTNARDARQKAITALLEIANNNTTEDALRAAAYEAIGAFPGKDARECLLRGLNAPTERARASALMGLARYIRLNNINENALGFQIAQAMMKPNVTIGERIGGVECLAALARNGYPMDNEEVLRFLFTALSRASAPELAETAAICLLYAKPELATRTAEAFLAEIRSDDKNRPVRVNVLLLKGLDNLMGKLAQNIAESRDADKSRATAMAIMELMVQAVSTPGVDGRLVDIGVVSLGGLPRSLDRQKAVAGLIVALKNHPERAQAIEESLMQFKRGELFRTIDDKPDVDQWMAWLEKNLDRLKPGAAPYL